MRQATYPSTLTTVGFCNRAIGLLITTTSGAKHQFRVSSVHDGAIYGDHDSVPFSEIASVERREYSATKTTILVVVILGVVGAIAAAVNSGEHPNTGL